MFRRPTISTIIYLHQRPTASGLLRRTARPLQSMLAALPNGTLVAAWQGSSGLEGGEDQRIWMATSRDPLGKEWEPPSPLPHHASHARTALWSPVLHCDTAGRLWLFYAESKAKCLRGEASSRVVRPFESGS
jgi:predicted neuraminidase